MQCDRYPEMNPEHRKYISCLLVGFFRMMSRVEFLATYQSWFLGFDSAPQECTIFTSGQMGEGQMGTLYYFFFFFCNLLVNLKIILK